MADGNHDHKHIGIVTGGADVKQRPPQVKTKDEAKKFLDEAVVLLKRKRADCDIEIPGNPDATAVQQQKAFRKMLLHVGVVMGEATAFYCAGLLDEIAYDHFHNEALAAMAGKTVGFIDGAGIDILRRRR